MKKLAILAILVSCTAMVAIAQAKKPETKVFGEIVDLNSYVAYGMKLDNPDRVGMAENSMKAGNPLGLLERGTAKLYVLTTNQADAKVGEILRPYFGMKVFVKGKVYSKGGVRLILMSDIGRAN